MKMTKIEQLYNSIQSLKELGVQLPVELIEETNRVEKEIIESEVIPTMAEAIEPIINQIKRELILVIEYLPDEPLSVKLTRKRSLTIPFDQEVSLKSSKGYKKKESYSISSHAKSGRTALSVTFPSGKIISNRYAYETLLDVINEIGSEKVKSLDIYCCGVPLISNKWDDFYRQHELRSGVLIKTHSSTETKKQQLLEISHRLGLNLKVEII